MTSSFKLSPLNAGSTLAIPQRRLFLSTATALSAGAFMPSAHAFDADDFFYISLPTGRVVRTTGYNLLEEGLYPAIAGLQAKLTYLQLFQLKDAEGRWKHGSIRDLISRIGFAATIARAINSVATVAKDGKTSAKAISLVAIMQAFLQAATGYLQTVGEYAMYLALKKYVPLGYVPISWEDEARRYLASALGWAATQTINGYLIPYATAAVTHYLTNGTQVSDDEKNRCDNILVLISPSTAAESYGSLTLDFETPVNQWNSTINTVEAQQEFKRQYRGTLGTNKLIALMRDNPSSYFQFTTKWETIDHNGEAGTCYQSNSFSICKVYDDQNGTRYCSAKALQPLVIPEL